MGWVFRQLFRVIEALVRVAQLPSCGLIRAGVVIQHRLFYGLDLSHVHLG